MPEDLVLVINTGSSSLKLGLYQSREADEKLLLDGQADRIGQAGSTLALRDAAGKTVRSEPLAESTEQSALAQAVRWLAELGYPTPAAIGHRVVHGGPRLTEHQRITPDVTRELAACVHFAPLHIPLALSLIEAAQRAYPTVPEFACFDTAFHRTLPETAAHLPLPVTLFEQGIRRYGFHGLSYESIVRQLSQLGRDLPQRTVIAHLGSGASLAAVEGGRSVDTSMGLTPTGGIPMATRSGDLDPGVLLYLLRTGYSTVGASPNSSPDALEALVNQQSGLMALSGGERDMRALETAATAGDAHAQLAIDIFTISIAKFVAGYATVLGGLNLLVFTGGIGEHSARVRQEVCRRLACLGIAIDEAANKSNATLLSSPPSTVEVRVLPSEEDQQIALHCRDLLHAPATPA